MTVAVVGENMQGKQGVTPSWYRRCIEVLVTQDSDRILGAPGNWPQNASEKGFKGNVGE